MGRPCMELDTSCGGYPKWFCLLSKMRSRSGGANRVCGGILRIGGPVLRRNVALKANFILASLWHVSLASFQIPLVVIAMVRIGAVFMVIGLACFMAFNMIGSTVDDAGVLHETFGPLPIGFGLLSIGVLIALFGWLRTCIR